MSGERWLRIIRRCLDRTTINDVFEPLVADWQHEWQRVRGSSWGRRALLALRWHVALAIQFCRCLVSPLPEPMAKTGFAGYAWTLLLGTSAGTLAFIGFVMIANPRVLVLGLPAVLGFAAWLLTFMLPIAMLPATMMAVRYGTSGRRLVAMLSMSVAAIIVVVGWLGPAGERVRLEATVQERAARGLNTPRSSIDLAMTLPELWRARTTGTLPRPATFELSRRAATPVWGLALAFLGVALASRGLGRSRLRIMGWWLAASAVMFGVWYAAIVQLHLASVAPWLVVLVVLMFSCGLWRNAPGTSGNLSEGHRSR